MNLTRRDTFALFGAATLFGSAGFPAAAQDAGPVVHEILMLNKHPDDAKETMVFLPDLIVAKPGDTLRFIATDKSHNVQADPKMLPEGVAVWKGKINEEVEVVVDVEGAHGFFCLPHRAMGMVGLVLVGDATGNLDAVKAVVQRGKAKARYDDIFARADAIIAAGA